MYARRCKAPKIAQMRCPPTPFGHSTNHDKSNSCKTGSERKVRLRRMNQRGNRNHGTPDHKTVRISKLGLLEMDKEHKERESLITDFVRESKLGWRGEG